MRARLIVELEAHEWYPGEPVTAAIDLPPLAYGIELVQARSDAGSSLVPKAWRGNPVALVGARIAAIALQVPISAVLATARPIPGLAEELAGAELSTGPSVLVDNGSPVPVGEPRWGSRPTRMSALTWALRVLTWVGLGVILLGLAYGWVRQR